MAPIVSRPFVIVDVATIKAAVKSSGEKPVKGDVRQLDAPSVDDQECKRVYAYKNRNWHYTGTLNTVTDTMFDVPEDDPAADATAPPMADELVAEPIVANVANATNATKEPVAETEAATADEKTESEQSDQSESDTAPIVEADAKPKKARKPRAPKAPAPAKCDGPSLESVLASVEALQIVEAKDMLKALIDAGGIIPVKGKNSKKNKSSKSSKSDSDASEGGEKPKRKLSDYTLFIQAEMRKIRETEPEVKSKDVMRQAMLRWKAHKLANGIVTVADKKIAAAVARADAEAVEAVEA